MNPDRLGGTSLREYLRVLRRRKWMVLAAVVLAPAAAVLLSLRQDPVYQSSAEVLLRNDNLAAALTGVTDAVPRDPKRLAGTQAELASTPEVATRALRDAGTQVVTPGELLANSDVTADPNTDILTFTVRNGDPLVAQQLADGYAKAYTQFRQQIDTSAIKAALDEAESRIDTLESSGQRRSAEYASLVDKAQTLRTFELLQTQNASVVRPAEAGTKVSPKPVRNGLLGLGLGLILGIALAFLWDLLDTRLRTGDDIQAALGVPLLAGIPAPPRWTRSEGGLVVLDEPAGRHAEAFRVLRMNLEFQSLQTGTRTVTLRRSELEDGPDLLTAIELDGPELRANTIMVTSSTPLEGKSTTIANLAVTMARAGESVILVDLDLRRPSVDRFFQIPRDPGVTDVTVGHVPLEDALVPIPLSDSAASTHAPQNGGVRAPTGGLLQVLPAGTIPPDPGEFVTSGALADVLTTLRERATIVLVDAPPLIGIGDALVLSARVDALFLMARLRTLKKPVLAEAKRLLEASHATALGFVLADAQEDDADGYAYAYGYYPAPARGATRKRALVR